MAESKRNRWALLGVLVLLVVGVLAFFLLRGGDQAEAGPFATLTVLEGTVEVADDTGDFATGRDGQSLNQGDVVRTLSDGRAELVYFDGSITRLDFDTTFTLEELASESDATKRIRGSVEGSSGRTWSRVNRLADAQSRFEVETPVATAAVRGTLFVTSCDETGCLFIAIQDAIEVCNADDECVTLQAFETVFVSSDGTLGPVGTITEEELAENEWILYNQCELEGRAFLVFVEFCPGAGPPPPPPPPTPTPTASPEPSPSPAETGGGTDDPAGGPTGGAGDDGDGDGGGGGTPPGPSPTPSGEPPPVDDDPPAPPAILEPDTGDVLPGLLAVDVEGKAEQGSTVKVYEDGAVVGITEANSPWDVLIDFPLGPHTIVATATDDAGNESEPSEPVTFVMSVDPPPPPPPVADLDVDKTGPDSVFDDEVATYAITVGNHGPDDAENVVLTDRVTGGRILGVASGFDCVISGDRRRVACDLGDLADGASASIGIDVTPGTAGTIVDVATVTSATRDPRTGNNSAGALTDVFPHLADLVLEKSGPASVDSDGTAVYTITVSNDGPATADDVVVTDEVTGGTVFDFTAGCDADPDSVSCDLGSLAPGDTEEITVEVIPGEGAETIEDTAAVTSSTPDPASGNNEDDVSTEVIPAEANLVVDKEGPDSIEQGDGFSYSIAVTNNGPAAATNVVITDILQSGGIINDIGQNEGSDADVSCPSFSPGPVEPQCTVDLLEPGDTATLFVEVSHNGVDDAVVNTATANADNAAAEASDTETTPVECAEPVDEGFTAAAALVCADLDIDKDGPSTVDPNLEIDYELSVENEGPQTATGVVVTDTLPAGVEFEDADIVSGEASLSTAAAPGECEHSAGVVTCNIGTLSAFDEVFIDIDVIAPDDEQTLVNTASVTSDSEDPDTGNNTDSASTDVESNVDAVDDFVTLDPYGDCIVPDSSPDLTANDAGDFPVVTSIESPSEAGGTIVAGACGDGGGWEYEVFEPVDLAAAESRAVRARGEARARRDRDRGAAGPQALVACGGYDDCFDYTIEDIHGSTDTATVFVDWPGCAPFCDELSARAGRDGERRHARSRLDERRQERKARWKQREGRVTRDRDVEARGPRHQDARASAVRASVSGTRVRLTYTGGSSARISDRAFPRTTSQGAAGCSGTSGCTLRAAPGSTLYVTVFAPGESSTTPVRGANAVVVKVPAAARPGPGDSEPEPKDQSKPARTDATPGPAAPDRAPRKQPAPAPPRATPPDRSDGPSRDAGRGGGFGKRR